MDTRKPNYAEETASVKTECRHGVVRAKVKCENPALQCIVLCPFKSCISMYHCNVFYRMKRDNLVAWLKILWVLLGFLLYPLLYAFVAVFRQPYFIIGYVAVMMAAIYMIFIRETAPPVAPLKNLPVQSAVMAVVRYRPGEEKEKRECVICLTEFEEDEEVAQIGCCGSIFHAKCVGRWAQCHSRTCPICHESYIMSV